MNAWPQRTQLDPEAVLLGRVLADPWEIDDVLAVLRSEMFREPLHAAIFERIKGYDERDRDPRLMVDDHRSGADGSHLSLLLRDHGGVAYLERLMSQFGAVPWEVARVAISRIREAWVKRSIIETFDIMPGLTSEAVDAAGDPGPPDAMLDYLIRRVDGVGDKLRALRASV